VSVVASRGVEVGLRSAHGRLDVGLRYRYTRSRRHTRSLTYLLAQWGGIGGLGNWVFISVAKISNLYIYWEKVTTAQTHTG
jgi:hypothetical protein